MGWVCEVCGDGVSEESVCVVCESERCVCVCERE